MVVSCFSKFSTGTKGCFAWVRQWSFNLAHLSPDPVLEGVKEDVGVNNTIFRVTAPDQWEKINKNNLPDNGNTARVVEPIPRAGKMERLTIEVTPEEIGSFKIEAAEISLKRTLMWSLPKFGEENMFK